MEAQTFYMKFNQNTFLIIQISILVKPQKSDWPMKGGREGPKHWAFGGMGSLSPGLKLGTGARRGAGQPERGSTARPQPRVAIKRLQCRSSNQATVSVLFALNQFTFKQLPMASDYHTGQDRSEGEGRE